MHGNHHYSTNFSLTYLLILYFEVQVDRGNAEYVNVDVDQ